MGAPVPLRSDFVAKSLRALAKGARDPAQTRRLLAVSAIDAGSSRSAAAALGGVGLQTVRDWVVAFNARGPDGLIGGKAPGARPRLNAELPLDQAGWHTTKKLTVPANITLVPLPARSSELDPVETRWPFMRGNGLGNRVVQSCADILDHGCHAWNTLIDRPWRIISIGLRDWAHEF